MIEKKEMVDGMWFCNYHMRWSQIIKDDLILKGDAKDTLDLKFSFFCSLYN